MQDTSTKIHFPDQNRIAGQRKSNRVAIRGRPNDIEEARQKIRNAVPVEFIVECNEEAVNTLGKQSLSAHFHESYGVLLRFYPRIDGVVCQVNLRGTYDTAERLKEAVNHFCRITRTFVDSVVMKLETSFDHVWLIRDRVGKITAKSGAGIRCPDLSNLNNLPKRFSIWIRGSMNSVYTASVMLNGYLPLQFTYQIPGTLDESMKRLARKKDILLNSEYSAAEMTTVRTLTYEKNAASLYELRRLCLRLPKSGTLPARMEASWDQLDDASCPFYSAVKQFVQQLEAIRESGSGRLFKEDPPQLLDLLQTSPSPASSSSSSGEQCLPVSLSAARFDANSFRHLKQLLHTLGLPHYSDLFLENEIDLALFTTLTDENLLSIGVSAFGARKIMTSAIKELTQ